MVYQTSLLFGLPFSTALAGFVFCGSVCSYNFHWFLTPPNIPHPTPKVSWNIAHRKIHLVFFVIGALGAAYFTILLLDHWFWLGVTAFLTFMYSAPKIPHPAVYWLRRIAVGKTIFLAFAWAHVTTLLPMVIYLRSLQWPHVLFFINRFFFIYAICILFDYRDVEDDRKAGIRSLITYLSARNIDRLFWFSVLVFFASTLALLPYFSVLVVAALLIPGIILCILYYPSKKNVSDYQYYFVLDGLMMLSAPLIMLAGA